MFQVEDALPDLGGREKKLFKGQDLCKYFCQYMFSFGLKVPVNDFLEEEDKFKLFW